MSIVRKLQKRASRLFLFGIDTHPSPSVCDGDTVTVATTTTSPTSIFPAAVPASTPATPIRSNTPDFAPDFEVAPVSASSTPPPAAFEKLHPVEYIAPRPRRSRSISFDTLRRRMSVLVTSPSVSVSALPGGAPLSPRMGPNGVLVTNGLFDVDGNPVRDAPIPRAVVPEARRGSRPMTTFFAPTLPPGAAEPVLGGILFDQSQGVETLDDDTLFAPPRRFAHIRSNSMSAADKLALAVAIDRPSDRPCNPATRGDVPRPREQPSRSRSPFARMSAVLSGAGHHSFLRGSSNMSSSARAPAPAPAVPPRSHLRGVPSAATSAASSASSSSAGHSPSASGRSSPVSDPVQSRPYILDVAPPPLDTGKSLPVSPVESDDDVMITFGKSGSINRRSKVLAGPSGNQAGGDPYKIRDGATSHSARSGVYTPRTFPGPLGNPGASTSPTSAAAPARAAGSAGSYVRARTVSGFKRLSTALHHPHHANSAPPVPPIPAYQQQQQRMQPPQLPPRNERSHSQPIVPTISYISRQQPQHSRQASRASSSTSPRASYSPSSVHSVRSISPPGTPTTPTSANNACGLPVQSVQAARSVVIVPADVAPAFERHTEVGLEPTPKPSPAVRPHDLPPISTTAPVNPPYATASPLPLSPTAPKRARRKPVPRLEEELAA